MKTPITYYGGKQQLADDIISMMPPHRIYCEPFFGGGAVFFAKGPSFLEVINDRNDLLITFYKQCVENFDRLQEKIQNTLHSESEYNKAKRIYNNPKHQSKLNVAWAVWVVTNMSVMATPRGGWKRDNGTGGSHVGVSMAAHRKNFTAAVYDRLKYVQISCKDAIDVIEERDTPDTFFYLDPPHINCDQKHYKGYQTEDFEKLLHMLSGIKGKFMLSNFHSDILSRYIEDNRWFVRVIDKKCMIPALISKPRRKQEVLVCNYRPYPSLFEE
jgi:DNA adenine methylase